MPHIPPTSITLSPEAQELFSGKPEEWAPYDLDARYLRWDSFGFSMVPKGHDAQPIIREREYSSFTATEREMLWRLTEACPEIVLVESKDCYANRICTCFEFPSSYRTRPNFEDAPPIHQTAFQVQSFWHSLGFQLLASRTGRVDLVLSFGCLSLNQDSAGGTELDFSESGIALISMEPAFAHRIPRAVIGIPALLVFQDIRVGGRYKLVVDRPVAPERLLPGILVTVTPEQY